MKIDPDRSAGTLLIALVTLVATVPAVAADDTTLEKVTITGVLTPDYRTEQVQVGPLGPRPLMDLPYAIDVVPDSLSIVQQLKSVRELFRYLPSVQGENIRPQTRGLQAGVVQNTLIDGMNIAATTDYPVEQFDRIEVLNGLAGALYGPASPAGTFNYVLKRPTAEPYRSVIVGYTTQSSALAIADVGDSIGPDVGDGKRFGFRLNAVADRGEPYVQFSRLERTLVSLALDFRLTADTRVELDGSRYRYVDLGYPGTFAVANGVHFPSAPDPTQVGLGQPYAGDDNLTKTWTGRLIHDFSSDWHVTAGILQQDSDRASTAVTNTLTNNAGAYTTTAATTTFSLDRIVSNRFALDGHLVTGPFTHDLLLANTGFNWERYTPYKTGAITLGKGNLADPALFVEPLFPDFQSRYKALVTRQQSVMVGDTVGWGDQWSLGVIESESWIKVRNLNKTETTTSRYDDSGISSNATLSYKPQTNMTAYVSYADNLQQGDIAPAGTLNAGTGLAPYRSKQYEAGYKVELGRLDLVADVFRIRRPYALVATDNIFEVQGEQVNDGAELSARGAVTDNLTVFGGVTFLDPVVTHTGVASTDDKQILGLSKVVSSMLLDYRIAALPGLAASVHVTYDSSRYGDNANTYRVAGYTTTDMGIRYLTRLWNTAVTWNVAVDNITDRHYWSLITPAGQSGYTGAGNGNGTLGAPRMVHVDMQVEF
jgi:iron complex outermembrane recepter protein